MAAAKFVILLVVAMFAMSTCVPVPEPAPGGWGGWHPHHTHYVIHVPYHVHTVHHHHEEPVYIKKGWSSGWHGGHSGWW